MGVCVSGSLSQPVLTQAPSASVSPGATAKLTCTLSSEHSTYTIEWYQQHPGKAPRYLMLLKSDGSHSKGDGIPDRFSGSSSGADRYLSIANVQSEDEADYICGVGYSGGYSTVSQMNREVGQKLSFLTSSQDCDTSLRETLLSRIILYVGCFILDFQGRV